MGTAVAQWASVASYLNNLAEGRGDVTLAHSGIMVQGNTPGESSSDADGDADGAEAGGDDGDDTDTELAPEGSVDPQQVFSKNKRLLRSAWEGSQKEIWTDKATLHFLVEGRIAARNAVSHRTQVVLRTAAR
jgi:hypothetical protein